VSAKSQKFDHDQDADEVELALLDLVSWLFRVGLSPAQARRLILARLDAAIQLATDNG